jgi:hypothetical protein
MSREIKFRAWNKLERNMVDCMTWTMRHVVTNDENDFDLMQYTGLKDKNGKDIYEGDVLKSSYYLYYVKWLNGRVVIMHADRKDSVAAILDIALVDGMEMSVVGNIYENPKLLKQFTNFAKKMTR